MDASTVKAKLKSWEREFEHTHGRNATLEDIKQDPIASTYKLHRQMSRDHHNSPSSLPFKPLPMPSECVSSLANPFASPRKPIPHLLNDPEHSSALGFGLHSMPLQTPTGETSASKARKRLRGEPVSPSPSKENKKRRLLKEWQQHKMDGSTSGDNDLEEDERFMESPIKSPPFRMYHPLFKDRSENGNLLENLAALDYKIKHGESDPTHSPPASTRSISQDSHTSQQINFQQSLPSSSVKPHQTEIRRKPIRSSTLVTSHLEATGKATNDGDGEIKVVEWRDPHKKHRRGSPDSGELDSPGKRARGILRGRNHLDGTIPLEVRLPEELKRALSLGDSQSDAAARDVLEETVAEDLISGRRLTGNRGIPTYGVGEVNPPVGEDGSGDEWEGNVCKWSGEL